MTFEKIGKKVFRKVSNSDPVAAAKMAYDDFKAAEEMIKAAEIGKLQPSFRKRHPVNPPTVDIPVLSVPHFSAIPDFALVDHKLAIKRQSSS